jgi:carboxymethylenebutenolidase
LEIEAMPNTRLTHALLASALLLVTPPLLATPTAGGPPVAAAERLEASPRHGEWVGLPGAAERTLHLWVSYPEVPSRAPAVLVIHENRGLTDWVRGVADRLAEEGFVAIAPDLLSGTGPEGGRTRDFPSEDAAREGISRLPPAQVLADLDAAASYALGLPAADGTLSVAGFCWGASRAFEFANHRPGLAATYVFYGTGPAEPEAVSGIDAPVFAFYGGDDARVNATVPRTAELMAAAGKPFAAVTYEGAGHAFLRTGAGADASPANRQAHDQAWPRWLELLRRHQGPGARPPQRPR